jgi:hypothetical protein
VAVAEPVQGKDEGSSGGFLGRWAKRKNDVRQGREPAPEAPQKVANTVTPAVGSAAASSEKKSTDRALENANAETTQTADAQTPAETPKPEPLTLQDANLLTRESDYTPFMARSVTPEVRNAAMKKLFTDPHFNVMDGLDIYIDDYSIASPMPASMLRQLASTKFLKFFEEDQDKPEALASAQIAPSEDSAKIAPATPSESPDRPDNTELLADDPIAQSTESDAVAARLQPAATAQPITSQHGQPDASQTNHDDLDLRLQPDHAPIAQKPGHGTE